MRTTATAYVRGDLASYDSPYERRGPNKKMRWLVRRFRRGTSTGAALTLLVLSTSLDGAAAAPPPQAAATVTCGETITKNTTLVADVGPCAGDGIIIGADNITLNLNGRTISGTAGTADGNAAGVRLTDRTGVTVTGLPGGSGKKGTVTGFDAGVVIDRGAGNTVENLSVQDNVGPSTPGVAPLGDGIAVFESANNRILNNVILRNGIYDGIAVLGLGADNNLIQGNLIADGIATPERRFHGGARGIDMSNFLSVNTRKPIRGNKVINNTIRNNPASGISTIANADGRIAGNTVVGNGYFWFGEFSPRPAHGIGIQGGQRLEDTSMRMVVEDNVVNENGIVGILVTGDTNDNIVRRNQVFRNGVLGIDVAPSFVFEDQIPDNNSVIDNRTGYNGVLDLIDDQPDCGTNVWSGNTWGPLTPLAEEFGLTSMIFPECTGAGGSLQTEAPAPSDSGPGSKAKGQGPPSSTERPSGPPFLRGDSEEQASDTGLTRRRPSQQ